MILSNIKPFIQKSLTPVIKRLHCMNLLSIHWQNIGDLSAASQLLATMRTAHILQPREETLPKAANILILAPHPDDEIIGCGGAMLKMIDAGCRVHVIYFTSDQSEVESVEIQAVSRKAGFTFTQLGFPMRNLPLDLRSLHALEQEIKTFQPHSIFLPFVLDDHPDHRDVSFALLEIANTMQTFKAVDIWAYQVYSCLSLNAVVNVGNVMEQKLALLRLYQSRFKPRDWAHYVRGLNAFNTRFLSHPTESDYAEIYFKTDLHSYLKLCRSYQGNMT